ncbi:hypothetical protein L2E82_41006 [Cichorium intybus]|uniref:Uncharacterized protein n=1 Tax=Cichorium intybus TaxID=13427 RepID=A0ACB9ALV1_CICIN|nr:hypothetical protein L2E82_41006 [Cichorium intybus]
MEAFHLVFLLLCSVSFTGNERPDIIPLALLLTSASIGSKPHRSTRTLIYSIRSQRTSVSPITSSSSISTNEEVGRFVADQQLTLRNICEGHVPDHILRRIEELGYHMPTEIQKQALPVLFSGQDCILHAQTGSGKTLAYLLQIFSVINTQRSAVQALILVPTRELGMQVAKVARILAAKPDQPVEENKSCTIMALLDGGTLRRQKSWLKFFIRNGSNNHGNAIKLHIRSNSTASTILIFPLYPLHIIRKLSNHRGVSLAVRDVLTSDPYFIIRMGKQKLKTRVVKNSINPVWDEASPLSVLEPLPVKLGYNGKIKIVTCRGV